MSTSLTTLDWSTADAAAKTTPKPRVAKAIAIGRAMSTVQNPQFRTLSGEDRKKIHDQRVGTRINRTTQQPITEYLLERGAGERVPRTRENKLGQCWYFAPKEYINEDGFFVKRASVSVNAEQLAREIEKLRADARNLRPMTSLISMVFLDTEEGKGKILRGHAEHGRDTVALTFDGVTVYEAPVNVAEDAELPDWLRPAS